MNHITYSYERCNCIFAIEYPLRLVEFPVQATHSDWNRLYRNAKRSVSNGENRRRLATYLCCHGPKPHTLQRHWMLRFWNKGSFTITIRYGYDKRTPRDSYECLTTTHDKTEMWAEISQSLRPQFCVVGSSLETPGIHEAIAKISRRDCCIGMDRKVLRRRSPRRLRPGKCVPGKCAPA
jgi:hypothetical protein